MLDFSPISNKETTILEFSKNMSVADLRQATNDSLDRLTSYFEGLTDADVVFDPVDETADDPYAVAGEENIGWNLAHLLVHVTASSEEGAAFSSLLARGFAAKERPRYETDWKTVTTLAQCIQRLEESRRIRLAYLDTWPDTPFLDVYRETSERFVEHFGQLNAPAAFLFGLMHEVGHYEQFEAVRAEALAARTLA